MSFYIKIIQTLADAKIQCPNCVSGILSAGAAGPYHQNLNDLFCDKCGYRVAIMISENTISDMIRSREDIKRLIESNVI